MLEPLVFEPLVLSSFGAASWKELAETLRRFFVMGVTSRCFPFVLADPLPVWGMGGNGSTCCCTGDMGSGCAYAACVCGRAGGWVCPGKRPLFIIVSCTASQNGSFCIIGFG